MLDGQRYLLPLCECMCVCDVVSGAMAFGADDLCGFYLSLKAGIRAWRMALGPGGWDLSLEAGI